MEKCVSAGLNGDFRDSFIENTSSKLILHPALAALIAYTVCEPRARADREQRLTREANQD